MRKRIYRSMLILSTITILISTVLTTAIIYRGFYNRMKQEVRNEAVYLSVGYNNSSEDIFDDLSDLEISSRITWVDSDGTVLYDSVADTTDMDNHASRPEIANALKYGYGEDVHLSDTLGDQTFYRAIRLNDGTVLRVSINIDSVYRAVIDFIPYLILILIPVILFAIILANKLTNIIIKPLNDLDLEEPLNNHVYDELSPLLRRMVKQNNKIKRQFIELKEQQIEFKSIIENVREGIIVLDDSGHILSINRSAAAIFGIRPKGNTDKHILTLNRSKTLQTAVQEAMMGSSYAGTFTKNNKVYNLLASPVNTEDNVKGVMLLLLDITEKEAAERIRREFSANVSHELKTPLTSIIGYAELMMNGMVKSGDYEKSSERIYNEAKHLVGLIDDIIRLSRLDERDVELSIEDIDLFELAQDAIERLDVSAKNSKVDLSISGESAFVSGVNQILEEMIYNLCDNAIKYNKENGKVNVDVTETSDNVILTVEDNGIGIAKDHQQRIFERFYRIDKSHSKDTGGTGLGLSIVKHSAEFHDAQLQLDSELGKGTKITVLFNKIEHNQN